MFRMIPDFNHESRNGAVCSILGRGKKDGDHGVFRVEPLVEYEGYFDICEDAVREMAHEIGMRDDSQFAALESDLETAQSAAAVAEERADRAEEAMKVMASAFGRDEEQ